MRPKRHLALVVIATMVVLAGCAGAGNSLGGGDGGQSLSYNTGADATAAPEEASQGDAERVQTQAIIRTGHVDLEVEDFSATKTDITTRVEELGGYVSDSHQEKHTRRAGNWTSGRLVVRVPEDDFETMMSFAEAKGTVEESGTQTEDVTDQLVDLSARLENLRAERDRLRTFYEEAEDTEALLAVEERLSEVQGEIERIEAQKRTLEDRVIYATITITLTEPVPDAAEPVPYHETPIVSAILSSVDGVVVLARAAAVTAAYALPYLVVFGAPFLLAGAYVVRRRRT